MMNCRRVIFLLLAAVAFSPLAGAKTKPKKTIAAGHRAALRRARLRRRAPVVRHPAGPKPAPLFQQDLRLALNRGYLAGSHIDVQLAAHAITLTGWVQGAENRGRATEQARLVARRDHWLAMRVYNRLHVR